jgi:hypothetical protein
MVMQEPGLYTIRIRERTTTIQDTTTHIQDIDIFMINMEIDPINFTAALTIEIRGYPIMSITVITMGQNVCTRGDIGG